MDGSSEGAEAREEQLMAEAEEVATMAAPVHGAPIAAFDPRNYLTKVGTSDYLEVKWRLVWLREIHPDAIIETELISHADQVAVFKARVALPSGGVSTGYGSEGMNDFREYFEKAETKAIGRALAALGFGTQFAMDLNEDPNVSGGIADSPIGRPASGQRQSSGQIGGGARSDKPATKKQFDVLHGLVEKLGLVIIDVNRACRVLYGCHAKDMNSKDLFDFNGMLMNSEKDGDLTWFADAVARALTSESEPTKEAAPPAQSGLPKPAPAWKDDDKTFWIDKIGATKTTKSLDALAETIAKNFGKDNIAPEVNAAFTQQYDVLASAATTGRAY